MSKVGLFGLVLILVLGATGCASSTPTDADQQKLAKEFSAENVAKEYEKKGMMKEAEEVRKNAGSQGQ